MLKNILKIEYFDLKIIIFLSNLRFGSIFLSYHHRFGMFLVPSALRRFVSSFPPFIITLLLFVSYSLRFSFCFLFLSAGYFQNDLVDQIIGLTKQ
jgi:hypothetical protein